MINQNKKIYLQNGCITLPKCFVTFKKKILKFVIKKSINVAVTYVVYKSQNYKVLQAR